MTKERKAMSVDVKEAVYSTTEGHDELPFRSGNPVYSDTWGVATVDPDSKQAFWAQVLHNGSSGKARHLLMVISDGKSSCEYAYTRPDDRLHSDLMDVELNGWKEYRVRSKRHDMDLNATRSEEHKSELQSLMRISYDVFCLKTKKMTRSQQDNSTLLTR